MYLIEENRTKLLVLYHPYYSWVSLYRKAGKAEIISCILLKRNSFQMLILTCGDTWRRQHWRAMITSQKKPHSQQDMPQKRLQHESTSSNSRVIQPTKERTQVSSKPRHNLCHWSGDLNVFCFLSFGAGSPSEYLHGRIEIYISLKQWRNREVESTE